MIRKRINQKEICYNRPDLAGIFYRDSMTYYRNASSPEAKVILMFPALAGRRGRCQR